MREPRAGAFLYACIRLQLFCHFDVRDTRLHKYIGYRVVAAGKIEPLHAELGIQFKLPGLVTVEFLQGCQHRPADAMPAQVGQDAEPLQAHHPRRGKHTPQCARIPAAQPDKEMLAAGA